MLPQDRKVEENQTQLDIVQRIAAKLRGLDAPRAPQGGLRVEAEALGLATDAREWRRGGTPPALATERPQPTPIGQDAMDVPLERAGGFNLRRSAPYPLAEADRRLQQAFGENLELRCAAKSRLSELALLQDDRKPSTVPEEVRRLKETMRRDAAQEATLNRRPSLQQRLQAIQEALAQLIQDQGEEDEEESPNGDWHDPRQQHYSLSASSTPGSTRVRTNAQGVIVDHAGTPIVLKGAAW
jgi:hypothetical protein